MNILLIGNGFDLEHGLPTRYKDFLDFCRKVKQLYTTANKISKVQLLAEYENWKTDVSIKDALLSVLDEHDATCQELDNSKRDGRVLELKKLLDELYGLIENNIWIEYFLNLETSNSYAAENNRNWYDFEQEIEIVAQSFQEAIDAWRSTEILNDSLNFGDLDDYFKIPVQDILMAAKADRHTIFNSGQEMDKFLDQLAESLEKLIRALEIYLAGFVEKIVVAHKCADIEKLKIDHILSFNYTSTYERIYDPQKSLKYNYIHGRANLENDVSLCNLVLGINEYLDDIRKDQDFEFLTFKKYYQRIYKGTDNYYLSWVEQIKNDYSNFGRNLHLNEIGHFGKAQFPSGERTIIPRGALSIQMHNLYIFGHSLTISDRDVLRTLILNDNVCTKIYYHRTGDSDKKALGELIRNLVRVIGQDELIRRTGGKRKLIEFVPQSI